MVLVEAELLLLSGKLMYLAARFEQARQFLYNAKSLASWQHYELLVLEAEAYLLLVIEGEWDVHQTISKKDLDDLLQKSREVKLKADKLGLSYTFPPVLKLVNNLIGKIEEHPRQRL